MQIQNTHLKRTSDYFKKGEAFNVTELGENCYWLAGIIMRMGLNGTTMAANSKEAGSQALRSEQRWQ